MFSIKYLIVMLMPVALQLMGLCFAVWSDPYIRREHRRIMLRILGLIACLIAQNLISFYLERQGMPRARTVAAIFGYSVRPLILLMFFYIVGERKSHWVAWALTAGNALIHLTALFSPVCFSINENNHYIRGPLGYTCHIISALLLMELIYMTVKKAGEGKKGQVWIPLFNALLIVASVIVDTFLDYREYPLSFLTIAVVSASVFYYIWLHLQFVRQHEQALQAEQRIQIMMTQIQPHFLFNTISTFRVLCRRDPDKAAEVAEKFGQYLRQNLDYLDAVGLIPIEKELAHTRLYTDIEMIRFENVRVEYDIRDSGYSLPPLTIQPLVENAIRHGVRIREEGIVQVTTRSEEHFHEIVIEDNGIGFDPASAEGMDSSHIGLRNVRERIENMCRGVMTIESASEKGTRITIRIPRGEKE